MTIVADLRCWCNVTNQEYTPIHVRHDQGACPFCDAYRRVYDGVTAFPRVPQWHPVLTPALRAALARREAEHE